MLALLPCFGEAFLPRDDESVERAQLNGEVQFFEGALSEQEPRLDEGQLDEEQSDGGRSGEVRVGEGGRFGEG
jgi:hypothetical protein